MFYLLGNEVFVLLVVCLYACPNTAIVDQQTHICLLELQIKASVRLTGVAPFKKLQMWALFCLDLVMDWSEISFHAFYEQTRKAWGKSTVLWTMVMIRLMCAWQLRVEASMSQQGYWAVRWNHHNDLHLSVMGTETHTWVKKNYISSFPPADSEQICSKKDQIKNINLTWHECVCMTNFNKFVQLYTCILITLHGTIQVCHTHTHKVIRRQITCLDLEKSFSFYLSDR